MVKIAGSLESRLGTHERVMITVNKMTYIVEDQSLKNRIMNAHNGDQLEFEVVSDREPTVTKLTNLSENERKRAAQDEQQKPKGDAGKRPAKETQPPPDQKSHWRSPATVRMNTTKLDVAIQIERVCTTIEEAKEVYRDLEELAKM